MSKKKIKVKLNKNGYKKEIINGNRKFDVDELIKAVNSYDKKFGIKLKKKDIWSDPVSYKEIMFAKSDIILAAMICAVNGIKYEDYFETDDYTGFNYGTISKPVSVESPVFTDFSVLDWDSKKTYRTDSLMFRCKFLTLVISQMLARIDKITENEFDKCYNYKHSKDEYQIILTNNILNHLLLFIRIMIHQENSYANIILKINEYLSCSKNKVNHRDLRNLLNNNIIETRESMKKNPFGERFLPDDMCIYNVLKISYMLATNKNNVKVLPEFKYIENATVKHDLIKLIEELGNEILCATKGKKFNPLFRAFVESRPVVKTQFSKEIKNNYELHVGIMALSFTKFVMCDETMNKFIDEMLKKGK